ncbi:NAD(P)/FAD-dependent oxidoreductase [Actinokineospora sp. NPDC004072]
MFRHVLVVGAGVAGLLTAVRCAAAGHRVTVLDRGPIPNPASTSFDQHRALRDLAPAPWVELEAQLGERFFRRVGVITAVAPEEAVGLPLAAPAAHRPVRFPRGAVRVFDPDAGVLLADRVLRAAVRWLSRHPLVSLRPWQPVSAVDCDAPAVTTARGQRIDADVLLVAAGPWTRELVAAPAVLHRQTMVYLAPPAGLARWWESAPCMGQAGPDGRCWVVPPGAGTLLKISTAAACREPGSLDAEEDEQRWVRAVLRSGVLVDADRYTVVATRRCHYTTDPRTGAGALTRVGPAAWVRAATGGDGFRTAPEVAARIAEALTAVPA